MTETQRKLVDLLHSIAMYNDKGFQWRGDSEDQRQRQRAQFRVHLDDLLHKLAPGELHPILLSWLRADHVLHEGEGMYARETKLWFEKHELIWHS